MPSGRVIHIQPGAPAKPPEGAPCNGCGVCCLLEPCPLGMLLSGRRRGACLAVQWDVVARRYRCAAVMTPMEVVKRVLPHWLHASSPAGAALLSRLAPRWIAAGKGCDSSVLTQDLGQPDGDFGAVSSMGDNAPPVSE